MYCLCRYLLVGFLTLGMAVDSASAARWFSSLCCGPPVVVEYCPPVEYCCEAPVVVYETTPACSPGVAVSEGSTIVDGDHHHQAPEPTPAVPLVQEPIAPPEESTNEAPSEDAQPENSVVKKPAVEPDAVTPPPVSPPAPVAVPEDSPASEAPAPSEPEPEPAEESLPDSPPVPSVPEPAPETPEAAPVPDVFDEPAAADDSSAEEEMSDEPAAEDSPSEDADPLQDLFGPASEEEPPAEADSPAAEPAESDGSGSKDVPSSDDLFGQGQDQPVLSQPGGLASQATRRWVDNTAQYQCEARLLRVASEKVLLARGDGQQVVVPFSRLSDDDLSFVHQQVVAKRQLLAKRTAVEKLASLWSD